MKRLITLALFTITLFSCQDGHGPEPVTERQTGIHIENISPYSDDNLIEALNKLGSENGRISSSFGGINMDSVLMITNESDIANYSFSIINDSAINYFDNFIVRVKNEISQSFVVRYIPDPDYVLRTNTLFGSEFSGEIILYNLQGEPFGGTFMVDGLPVPSPSSGRIGEYPPDCFEQITCYPSNTTGGEYCYSEIVCLSGGQTGSSGNSVTDFDFWTGSDEDDIGNENDPIIGDGSSSGGGGSLSGGGSTGTNSGNSGESTSGENDYIGVKPSLEDAISKFADLWEQQNITLNQSFKDDPLPNGNMDSCNGVQRGISDAGWVFGGISDC
ncbi:hypothetical protein [Marinoscillum sp.]|uniref:hypothetical protein n=1 Tax=Marinoscillum sp. TaxID=2024838 RepID=UPI003BA92B86